MVMQSPKDYQANMDVSFL